MSDVEQQQQEQQIRLTALPSKDENTAIREILSDLRDSIRTSLFNQACLAQIPLLITIVILAVNERSPITMTFAIISLSTNIIALVWQDIPRQLAWTKIPVIVRFAFFVWWFVLLVGRVLLIVLQRWRSHGVDFYFILAFTFLLVIIEGVALRVTIRDYLLGRERRLRLE